MLATQGRGSKLPKKCWDRKVLSTYYGHVSSLIYRSVADSVRGQARRLGLPGRCLGLPQVG